MVEAAISLLEYGGLGTVQGLDVQVNDATGGARTAIRNWADPTGAGYQTTARWGVATLVEGTLIDQAFTPQIIGSAIVGKTLSVSGLPTGTTLTYQWLRNGSPISGATQRHLQAGSGRRRRQDERSRHQRVGGVQRPHQDVGDRLPTVLKTFSKVTTPKIAGIADGGPQAHGEGLRVVAIRFVPLPVVQQRQGDQGCHGVHAEAHPPPSGHHGDASR